MRQSTDYQRELACRAPRERVVDAITTLPGLRRWWTPIVTGSATTHLADRVDLPAEFDTDAVPRHDIRAGS